MGENTVGEKFDPWEILQIYPMYTDDIIKSFKEGSPLDLATIIPTAITGVGYMEYEKDIRKAKLEYYLTDKELSKFLKQKQLNISSSINQEVYDADKGELVKMTKEQSDRYEKIWADYIIDELKESKGELSKLSEEKLKKEISKIKTEATKYAKLEITGVPDGIGTIQETTENGESKTYELTPDQVKQRIEIGKRYTKELSLKSYISEYVAEGMKLRKATIEAKKDFMADVKSESRQRMLELNDEGKITLKEKP
jgi:hypothetical protein